MLIDDRRPARHSAQPSVSRGEAAPCHLSTSSQFLPDNPDDRDNLGGSTEAGYRHADSDSCEDSDGDEYEGLSEAQIELLEAQLDLDILIYEQKEENKGESWIIWSVGHAYNVLMVTASEMHTGLAWVGDCLSHVMFRHRNTCSEPAKH